MNRSRLLCCLAIALLMMSFNKSNMLSEGVHLKGHLIDMGTTQVPLIYDGASSFLNRSDPFIIQTDEQGYFDTIVPISTSGYYNINRNTLYLSPGDDMTISISQNSEDATFEGVGAEANTYIKDRLYSHTELFFKSANNIKASFEETKQSFLEQYNQQRKRLEALQKVSDDFKRLEEARIKGDIINFFINYPAYGGIIKSDDFEESARALEEYYKSITDDIKPLYAELKKDTTFLNVAVVRDVLLYAYMMGTPMQKLWKGRDVNDHYFETFYKSSLYIKKLSHNQSPELISDITAYADSIDYPMIKDQLRKKVKKLTALASNCPAVDFVMQDLNGNSLHLSDLKGKIIYIDLWATWCRPCLKVSPHFESLAKKYKDHDEILFVSISMDNDVQTLKTFLSSHPKELKQYHCTDIALRDGWQVNSIPRFILIDKDFNIIDSNAPRPNSSKIIPLLDRLLK